MSRSNSTIVRVERSGGFAGLQKRLALNTRELPLEDRQQLSSLIEAADFFNLPGQIFSPQPGADRFQYKVLVETENEQHQVTFDEGAASKALVALVRWVEKRI